MGVFSAFRVTSGAAIEDLSGYIAVAGNLDLLLFYTS
jgi:hypothetical protein